MIEIIMNIMIFICMSTAASAANVTITFYNFTGDSGLVYLGSAPQVLGPSIATDGNSAVWTTVLSGSQSVGLQIGDVTAACFTSLGPLVLNEALYTGDPISVLYGQPQLPNGIACGCYGSACGVG